MRNKLAVLWCAAAVIALQSATRASVLAYDGFDYPTGALAGDNGGTGWGGAWSGQGNVVAPIGTVANPVVGNAAQGGDFGSLGARTFASTLDVGANYPTGPGVPYYFSFLVNFSTGTFDFGGTINAGFTTGGNAIELAFAPAGSGSPNTVNMSISADPSGDTVPLQAGTTYLIAGEITATYPAAYDPLGVVNVSAYSTSAAIPASTPAWQLSYTDSSPGGFLSYNNLGLTGFTAPYSSSGGDLSLDEVTVGTQFSDVASAGVPEPASLGVTCVAASLLLRRRARGQA